MTAARNIGLLLWRNALRRKRAPISCAFELLCPVLVVLVFVGLYGLFTPKNSPDRMYLENYATVPTLAGVGYRLANSTSVIALGRHLDANV